MTIFITGGCGFIGSAVVRCLLAECDYQIVNIDKLTYAGHLASIGPAINDDRHTFEKRDICNRSGIDSLFRRFKPSAVLHFAAESHVDRSIDAPADFIMSNVLGTYTLLEAAYAYWKYLPSVREKRWCASLYTNGEVTRPMTTKQTADIKQMKASSSIERSRVNANARSRTDGTDAIAQYMGILSEDVGSLMFCRTC